MWLRLTDPAEAYLRTDDERLDRWWERGEAGEHLISWPEAPGVRHVRNSTRIGPKDLRALSPELKQRIETASTSLLLGQEISMRTPAGLIRGRLRRFRRGKAVVELVRTGHGMPGVMRGIVRTDSSSPIEKVELAILTCLRAIDRVDNMPQGESADGPRP